MLNTTTTKVTDTRRSVFVELRERSTGAESIVAWNEAKLASSYKKQYGRYADRYSFQPAHKGVNVWQGAESAPAIEVFFDRKGEVHVKPCKLQNISTPYTAVARSPITNKETETFYESSRLSVVSTLAAREQFTRDVYTLAEHDANPMMKVSALKAMEQHFLILVYHGKISRERAEKAYDKYDKIQARIWRGATPGEQVNSFHLAYRLLARECGLIA